MCFENVKIVESQKLYSAPEVQNVEIVILQRNCWDSILPQMQKLCMRKNYAPNFRLRAPRACGNCILQKLHHLCSTVNVEIVTSLKLSRFSDIEMQKLQTCKNCDPNQRFQRCNFYVLTSAWKFVGGGKLFYIPGTATPRPEKHPNLTILSCEFVGFCLTRCPVFFLRF